MHTSTQYTPNPRLANSYLLTNTALAGLFDDARPAELGHVLTADALLTLVSCTAVTLLA